MDSLGAGICFRDGHMEIRYKLIVKLLIMIPTLLLSTLFVLNYIQTETLSIRGWLFLIFMPYTIYLSVFVCPTTRIIFSAESVSIYWKIGIGSLIIWEKADWRLPWPEVGNVFSYFPIWLPFKAIGVLGFPDQKRRMFFLGTLTTEKKESLVYVGDHVAPEAIDEDVQRLIEKYRRQLQKKAP